MKKISNKLGMLGGAAVLLFLACGIISGTWVVKFEIAKNNPLFWTGEFYYSQVDMSEAGDWEDHKDHLKDIDLIGFELWAVNNTDSDKKYRVYAASDGSGLDATSARSEIETSGTLILDDVPLPPGINTHITYGQSFKYLKNFEKLVSYAEDGSIRFFAMETDGAVHADLHVDSMYVIVTFTAGL
ncbi:MAG: hypothetical protein KOO62_12935 [candidate division Zixibacteria bacterium]|nr:hypothetical protein [candidate division Zixibacteria bacterium]